MKKGKQLFRRAMSLFLAFAMVFTSTPTGALAQDVALNTLEGTVQFFVKYGEEAPTPVADKDQKIALGEKAVNPQLVIDGYTLGEWHILSAEGMVSELAYNFDTPVEKDLALVAIATASAQTLDETVVEDVQPIVPDNGTEGTVADDTQKDTVADDTVIDEAVVDDTQKDTVVDDTVVDETVIDETVVDETQDAAPFALSAFGSNSNLLDKHAVLAISVSNERQLSEPSLNTDPFNLYSEGKWISDGESGHANCAHDKCYTKNASDILTENILDKLIQNGNGDKRVNGYADPDGIDAYFTADFKSNVLPKILQQYLDKYKNGERAENYKMVFYVAKYQTNDDHWHIDGIIVKKSTLSVSYDKNSDDVVGAAPDKIINIAPGTQYTVKGKGTLERDGFTFAGWNTQPNGGGTDYKANDKITVNENITLYAVWKQDLSTYTVTVNLYDKNYGTATDKDLIDTKTTSVQFYLISGLMNKDSEELFEQFWTTFDANEEDFYSENPYWTPNKPNRSEKNYIVNIYIKERSPEGMLRTISFENAAQGGTMSPSNASFTVLRNTLWSKADITIPTVTPDKGYELLGWRENGGELYTNEQVADRNVTISKSRTYTAEYKKLIVIEKASVYFDAGNGGKFAGTTQTRISFADKIVGKSFAENNIIIPTPVANDGYYFTGWTPATPANGSLVNKGQDGNTYTANFAQKTAITINSVSSTQRFNGEKQIISGIVPIDGLTFQSDAGVALTATAQGVTAGVYATTFNMEKDKVRVIKNGSDVTEQYTITLATGKLVIQKIDLKAMTHSYIGKYNGGVHSASIIEAEGLPLGFVIEQDPSTKFPTITDVGEVKNVVDVLIKKRGDPNTIYNDCFNITINYGKLLVLPLNITVTAQGGLFAYDGTVHTGEAAITGEGFVNKEGIDNIQISGGIRNVGKSNVKIGDITFLEGTKAENYRITKVDGEVEVIRSEAQNLTIKLNDQTTEYNGKVQSPTAEKDFYTISNGTLVKGDKVELKLSGSGKDADTYEINATANVTNADGEKVTDNYIINVTSGNFTINPAPLKVTVGTKERAYNGEPLTADGITSKIVGLLGNDDITVSSKGETLFDTVNTHDTTITAKDNTKLSNYVPTIVEGKLVVTQDANEAMPITIKGDDLVKFYDGTPLVGTTQLMAGTLANGDEIRLVNNTQITDASSKSYKPQVEIWHNFEDQSSVKLPNYCYNITVANGKLQVKQRNVVITANSGAKAYDGTPLTAESMGYTATQFDNNATGNGFIGEQGFANVTLTGNITQGNPVTAVVKDFALNDGTNKDNYNITKVNGTLTITNNNADRIKLSLKAGSSSKYYDGKALEENTYSTTLGELKANDQLVVLVNGSATNVADSSTSNNTITSAKVMHNENGKQVDVSDYYDISLMSGSLVINPRNVVIAAKGGAKAYDGTALTAQSMGYTATAFDTNEGGNGFVKNQGVASATITGEITYGEPVDAVVSAHELKNNTLAANYNVSYKNGTIAITNNEQDRMNVTLTAGSASKIYDGAALTAGTFTAENGAKTFALHTGDKLEVFVNGTITNVFENAANNNVISDAKIYRDVDGDKVEVTQYYNIEKVNGTLAITPKAISAVGNTTTLTADNQEHTVTGAAVTGLINGFTANVPAATATRTAVGTTYMGLTTASSVVVTNTASGLSYVGNANNSYAKNYTLSSVVDGSITLNAAPTPPVAPAPGPAPVAPIPPVAPAPAPVVPPVAQEEVIPEADAPAAAPEEPIVDENAPAAAPEEELIEETDAPKAAPSAWALINLLLAVATVLGSVTLLVTYFARKKREEEAKAQNANEETRKAIKRRGAMRILSLIPSLASVIAFILTENMKNPMAFVDKWTVLMVIIAVVQIVVMVLAKKKIDNEQKGDQKA